jgi:hypothetical protein
MTSAMPLKPVQELKVAWTIEMEGSAIGTVDVVCEPTQSYGSTSYHLYTVGPNEKVVPGSFEGRLNGRSLVYLSKKAPDWKAAGSETSTSATLSSSSNTLVDSGELEESKIDSVDDLASIAYLRNNSMTVNRLNGSAPKEKLELTPFHRLKENQRYDPGVYPQVPEYFEMDNGVWYMVYSEHGSCQTIGKIATQRGVYGNMIVAELGPGYVPGKYIYFQFQVVQAYTKLSPPVRQYYDQVNSMHLVPKLALNLKTIPPFTQRMCISVRGWGSHSLGSTIAELSPTCVLEKFVDDEMTTFQIPSQSLTDIPLKREIELILYHSIVLKEVNVCVRRSYVVAKFIQGGDGVFNVRYTMDFDIQILTPVAPSLEGRLLYTEISIADGPVESAELCHSHRFVNDCGVRLTNDETVSYIQLMIPYNGREGDVIESLQLSFEKQYHPQVSAIYVPKIQNPKGNCVQHNTIVSVLSCFYPFKVDTAKWAVMEDASTSDQCITYSGKNSGHQQGLVLFLQNQLTKPHDLNSCVRDIVYKFVHTGVDSRVSALKLEMGAIIDVSQSRIGQRIMELNSLASWGYPKAVYIDNILSLMGEFCFDDEYKVSIYRRSLSKKRDVEVKFIWSVRVLNSPHTLFKGRIPSIANDTETNVKIEALSTDSINTPVYGYVQPETRPRPFYLANGHVVIHTASFTDNLTIKLTTVDPKPQKSSGRKEGDTYDGDEGTSILSNEDEEELQHSTQLCDQMIKWIVLLTLFGIFTITSHRTYHAMVDIYDYQQQEH